MTSLLWVMAGSAVGASLRLWVVDQLQRRLGHRFPWGTLIVNARGALIIGVLAGVWLTEAGLPTAWHFVATGVLGSYTTVSSFSLQTLALWQAGEPGKALMNILGSLLLCLSMVACGFLVGAGMVGS
jgi:fluoride exporter